MLPKRELAFSFASVFQRSRLTSRGSPAATSLIMHGIFHFYLFYPDDSLTKKNLLNVLYFFGN